MIALAALAIAVAAAPPIELSVRARSQRPGELVVLAITLSEATDHVRVHAFDREAMPYRTGDRSWHALFGIDLAVRPGTYAVTVDAGDAPRAVHAALSLVVTPRLFPTRRLTVNEAFVTPPASVEARIADDAALLASVWRSSEATRLWLGPFVRPVPGPANSAFGSRSIFNRKPRNPHGGADFLSPAGTPVHAPNGGRVVVARDLYFSGNTVIIDHGLGLFSLLAHLSAIDVHEGDDVTTSQLIGLVGATGRVTGPHLHWAVRAGDARVDPLSLLDVLGKDETP